MTLKDINQPYFKLVYNKLRDLDLEGQPLQTETYIKNHDYTHARNIT